MFKSYVLDAVALLFVCVSLLANLGGAALPVGVRFALGVAALLVSLVSLGVSVWGLLAGK